MPASVIDIANLAEGERDENEVRKSFTPSERVAVAKAIEEQIGKRSGQRTDLKPREIIPEVEHGRRTSEVAATKAGFGNSKTYEQAKKVTERPGLLNWSRQWIGVTCPSVPPPPWPSCPSSDAPLPQ